MRQFGAIGEWFSARDGVVGIDWSGYVALGLPCIGMRADDVEALMPTTVACFQCGFSAIVDFDHRPMTVTYDHAAWTRTCGYPDLDSVTLCANMRALLRVLGVRPEESGALSEHRLDRERTPEK